MSRIIPFSKCIARPSDGHHIYYLQEHLEGVRQLARSFFPDRLDSESQWLMELAAISHDIAKADAAWQKYIHGITQFGPNHSGSGAIFFSYLAYHLLQKTRKWDVYSNQLLWLCITRDIADHHGVLKGYAKNWDIEKGNFQHMDLDGIQQWLYDLFPIMKNHDIPIEAELLDDWQYDTFDSVTDEVFDLIYERDREEMMQIDEKMELLQQWRELTSILIAADRIDISPVQDRRFSEQEWKGIDYNISEFCEQGKSHPLAKIRSDAQKSILDQWKEKHHFHFFVLEMPTGYGKTITSLKLASEMAKKEGFSKIVYVAPYLSILEQNADSIEKAIKHTPLQHHSLAIVDEKVVNENVDSDEHSDLAVQSWANQIVCTSFVQWMKAIFPSRAQETLRRIFLRNAVIIIDEPQIMDAAVWNLFLKGLEALSKIYHNKVILCSATMPPFDYGLKKNPARLHVSSEGKKERYQIKVSREEVSASECAEKLTDLNEPTAAAIVNTIQDSIDLFDAMPETANTEKYLLHGFMIPVHKSIQLKKIQEKMQLLQTEDEKKKIRVISTQILEAGVDLSFHYMFRALPILPSLIQAAGRVNRHGEKEIGLIETAKFIRNEKDTRFIYGRDLSRISDDLLFEKEIWYESELGSLVAEFYKRMFQENRYESVLQDIDNAFAGNWELLSRHEVFRNDTFHRLPIFIPYPLQQDSKYIPENIVLLMREFDVDNAEEIYELFSNKSYRRNWSFQKHKRFQILFHQFVVNVPADKALKIVSKDEFLLKRVPMLEDNSYSMEKGLAVSTENDYLII